MRARAAGGAERRRREGFTLVEVVIALAVLALLTGGIIAAVNAGLRTTVVIADEELREQRRDAFLGWCRESFANLPATSRISRRLRESGRGTIVELLFTQAPGAFLPAGFGGSGAGVAVSAIPDGKGTATLSAMRFPDNLREEQRDEILEAGPWIPLLRDLSRVEWKFLERGADEFTDEWTPDREKPALVRLDLEQAGGPPAHSAFWIPPATRGASGATPGPTLRSPPDDLVDPVSASDEAVLRAEVNPVTE